MTLVMNRAKGLLAPADAWLCRACGWGTGRARPPERCPKCGGSAFERTGAAGAVEEAEREAERLGGPDKRRTAMADLKCVDGCGRKVSRPGGRCRTYAGVRRRQKRPSGAAAKADPPPKAPKKDFPHSPLPLNSGAIEDVATALRAAGFNVADVRVQEATLLVHLTA